MGPLEGPRAIGGGPLWGSKPLRFIYLDEAGTSAGEPVAVVSGVVIDADRDWLAADGLVRELVRRFVPDQFREGFVFHAKSVWGDKKFRDGWPLEQRLELIKSILRTPFAQGFPIAMGACWKDVGRPYYEGRELEDMAHATAFMSFTSMADRFIAKMARPKEVGTLIAEDNPRMRRMLRFAFQRLRDAEYQMPGASTEGGVTTPQNMFLGVRHIVDTVHFVDKQSGPLLQIADACAFAFRRFFSGQSMGAELVKTMLGSELDLAKFKGSTWPSGIWFPADMKAGR